MTRNCWLREQFLFFSSEYNQIHTKKIVEKNRPTDASDYSRAKKVRNQNHEAGKYRGAAHVISNLKTTQLIIKFLAVALQNIGKNDERLLFNITIKRRKDKLTFNFVASTDEKYAIINFDSIIFPNSFVCRSIIL